MAPSRSTRALTALSLLLLPIALVGCAKLDRIETRICGNAIVEPSAQEDCDGYSDDGEYCNPPGTEHACRYSCAEPSYRCPAEMACGADGVCHAGKSTYSPWGKAIPVSASRLLVGDFDGDKREDLVTLGRPSDSWQALPKVFFFDEVGSSRDVFDPKLAIGAPSIIHESRTKGSTSEEVTKLLFSIPDGIASMSATPDRVVFPDPYPYQALTGKSSYRVIPIQGLHSRPLDVGILVLYGISDSNRAQTQLIGVEEGKSLGLLPKPIETLVGDFLAANIDLREESPCDEFLFGYAGDATVYSVATCTSDGKWRGGDIAAATNDPSVPVVRLPAGHFVADKLVTAHLDSDLFLDLIVGDGNGHAFVSFGLGDGTFAADPTRPEATLGQAWPLVHDRSKCEEQEDLAAQPLAAGDLNKDGKDDLVMPGGILLVDEVSVDPTNSSIKVEACQGNVPFVGEWSTAVVADFTRDGLLDLIAGVTEEPDLDFYLGTGRRRMNPFGITTEGNVRHLRSGDFDGDLVTDLAFSARVASTAGGDGTPRETVYIAFGNTSGAPSLVTSIGTFRDVRQLSSADYVDTDAIAELGVVSPRMDTTDAVGEQLAVFVGNPGRHPIAPLGLSVMSVGGPEYDNEPLAVGSGHLAAVEGSGSSALALGVGCGEDCQSVNLRLWLSLGTDTWGLQNPKLSRALPADLVPVSRNELAIHLVSGDTNGDDKDEFYVLSASPRSSEIALWPVDMGTNVFSVAPDGPDVKEPLGTPSFSPGRLLFHSNPTILDADNDGQKDLVLLTKQIDAAGNEVMRLLVAWNDGGKLELSSARIDVDLDGEQPLGIFARTSGPRRSSSSSSDEEAPRLWAITATRVFEIPLGEKDRRARKGRALKLASTRDTSDSSYVPGGQALAVGDLTGDGLLDLVIATQGSVRIFAETDVAP